MKKLLGVGVFIILILSTNSFAETYTINANFSNSKIKDNEQLKIKTNLINQKKRRVSPSVAQSLFSFTNNMLLSQYSDSSCQNSVGDISISGLRSGMEFNIPPMTLSTQGKYARVGNFIAGITSSCLPLDVVSSQSSASSISVSVGSLQSGRYPISGQILSSSGSVAGGYSGKLTINLVSSCSSALKLSGSRNIIISPKNGIFSLKIAPPTLSSGSSFSIKLTDSKNQLSSCYSIMETVSPPRNFQFIFDNIDGSNYVFDDNSITQVTQAGADGVMIPIGVLKDKYVMAQEISSNIEIGTLPAPATSFFLLNQDKTVTPIYVSGHSNFNSLGYYPDFRPIFDDTYISNNSYGSYTDGNNTWTSIVVCSQASSVCVYQIMRISDSGSATVLDLGTTDGSYDFEIRETVGDKSLLTLIRVDQSNGYLSYSTIKKDLSSSVTWSDSFAPWSSDFLNNSYVGSFIGNISPFWPAINMGDSHYSFHNGGDVSSSIPYVYYLTKQNKINGSFYTSAGETFGLKYEQSSSDFYNYYSPVQLHKVSESKAFALWHYDGSAPKVKVGVITPSGYTEHEYLGHYDFYNDNERLIVDYATGKAYIPVYSDYGKSIIDVETGTALMENLAATGDDQVSISGGSIYTLAIRNGYSYFIKITNPSKYNHSMFVSEIDGQKKAVVFDNDSLSEIIVGNVIMEGYDLLNSTYNIGNLFDRL